MKMSKKLIIGIFALAILLIPLATASEAVNTPIKNNMLSKSYTFTTNESTSKVLAQVYGTNITMAEFMEKVYPGSLKVLPKDTVARLRKTPMTWPKPNEIKTNETQMVGEEANKSSNSGAVSPSDIINGGHYEADGTSYQYFSTSTRSAYYSSTTRMVYPSQYTTIPEISVTSYFYKDSGSSPIASATNYGFNTNTETASGTAPLSSGTHSYYTSGYHYVVWPVGTIPPYTSAVTVTPRKTVTV